MSFVLLLLFGFTALLLVHVSVRYLRLCGDRGAVRALGEIVPRFMNKS